MDVIKNFIKGIVVGVATLVPGVSGGTTAIILGVYDRLVHSVGSFFKDWKKNFLFLFQVGLGGALGILLFSRLMESAMTAIPHIMRFLFIGIITGGLPVLFRKAGVSRTGASGVGASRTVASGVGASRTVASVKSGIYDYLFLILGFAIVLLMSSEPEAVINLSTEKSLVSYIFLVLAGVIFAIALVLPGISFSFMLLAVGMYDITISAIKDINIPYLIPLGIGIAAGTFGTARIIEKLLKKHPRRTYMLIIGFVLGSLAEVFPGIPQGWQLIVSVAAMCAGFAVMYWLGKKGVTD